MACYHLSVKSGSKGFGRPHALYIMREGKYTNLRTDEQLEEKRSGNMPCWVEKVEDFWEAADQHERANGRIYTEIEIALPNELSVDQRKELVAEFVKEHLGKNHAYTYCIHNKKAALDPSTDQPHAHIMFSERELDGFERSKDKFFKRANSEQPALGGAKKSTAWKAREKVFELRKSWATIQNKHLEKNGHDIRVDHRSLQDQLKEAIKCGDQKKIRMLDRPADIHLGPKLIQTLNKERKIFGAQNQEFQSKSEKINYSLDARRLKYLIYQLEKEFSDCEVKPKKISIPNKADHIKNKINKIDMQIKIIMQKQKSLAPHVKTEEDAKNIARTKVFGNIVQEIKRIETEIKKEQSCYNAAKKQFESKPKISIFDFKSKKENQKRVDQLEEWKTEINRKVCEFRKIETKFQEKMNDPSNKQKMNNIQREILLKNQEKRDQFHQLMIGMKELQTEKKILLLSLKSLNKNSLKIKRKEFYINKASHKILHQSKKINNQIKKIREEHSKGGIEAKIIKEKESWER